MTTTKSFHSTLVKHPECRYWGNWGKSQYFEFRTEEQLLTIRFDDYQWQLGMVDGPSFINAELSCNKTGDTIEYTTSQVKAKQLLKQILN